MTAPTGLSASAPPTRRSVDSLASSHVFARPESRANPPAKLTTPRSLTGFTSFLLGFDESEDDTTPELDDAWSVATKRRGVYNLLAVPAKLERLITLGQFICMDEFLTIFTFLPLRVAIAILSFLFDILLAPFRMCWRQRRKVNVTRKKRHVARVIDILHVSLLLFTAFVLSAVDVSWIYHNIRGQSVIKLYVVFNVIEIFDRLGSSFGVDILDSLGWTTASAVAFLSRLSVGEEQYTTDGTDVARARAVQGLALLTRMTFDYLSTLVYVVLHALLLLTWVVTLNVAINTQNNALLTLLVSNNFVELKGAVFKSFKVQNLFQISCSDAVERFQLNVFLGIMLVVTSGDKRLFTTWGIIYLCEVIVDWIKHAFVTKFNRIPYRVYHHFSVVICDDMIKTRKHSVVRSIGGSAVSKRIGFVSLPLAAVVIRMGFSPAMTLPTPALAIIFISLIMFKTALSIGLIGHAHRKMKSVVPGTSQEVKVGDDEDRDQDIYWHRKLVNIERYDLISKN